MKIVEFEVIGLFGLYNHKIDFSTKSTHKDKTGADVIMIYGQNGIGKTTILRMLEGLMTLDFDVFRIVKFQEAFIKFSNNKKITVKRIDEGKNLSQLEVNYIDYKIILDPKKKGVLDKEDKENKEKEKEFIEQYEKDIDNFLFDFIDTERLLKRNAKEELISEQHILRGKIVRSKVEEPSNYFSSRIRRFISDSQINHSRYFQRTEPELFDKILSNLEKNTAVTKTNLINRLHALNKLEKKFQIDRIGLVKEKWNKKKLITAINTSVEDQSKLKIISSYIEFLEDRNKELQNVAERLLKFETIINRFLLDKSVSVNRKGLDIKSRNGDRIKEEQLSTGEYHLLYLSVLALSTKVKGTIIAIDEPEMSMHVSWQDQLVKALVDISSKAFPQMIFATHSPDIAKDYDNSLITSKYE